MQLCVAGCKLAPPPKGPGLVQRQRAADQAIAEADTEVGTARSRMESLQDEARAADSDASELKAARRKREAAAAEAASLRADYDTALARAAQLAQDCQDGSVPADNEAVVLHAYFSQFEGEPDRDEAIRSLERCRKLDAAQTKAAFPEFLKGARSEFALAIEDAFDDANRFRRGSLKARVRGTELHVSMRGNFEGRRRHSQDAVDRWCGSSGAAAFTKIVLKNGHGTFSCLPPVGPKETLAAVLEDAGIATSWVPPSAGERPVPPGVSGEPSTEGNLAAEQRADAELAAAQSELSRAEQDYAEAEKRAHEARRERKGLDDERQDVVDRWRADKLQKTKSLERGGLIVGGAGALAAVVGLVGLGLQRSTSQDLDQARAEKQLAEAIPGGDTTSSDQKIADLDDKSDRQRTIGLAGLGVGAALLVVGGAMYFGARNRKGRLERVTASAGGLRIAF